MEVLMNFFFVAETDELKFGLRMKRGL